MLFKSTKQFYPLTGAVVVLRHGNVAPHLRGFVGGLLRWLVPPPGVLITAADVAAKQEAARDQGQNGGQPAEVQAHPERVFHLPAICFYLDIF